jgi:6-phosphogluconolactonase/glucosamine-6-phosphate isomerase/deaminase
MVPAAWPAAHLPGREEAGLTDARRAAHDYEDTLAHEVDVFELAEETALDGRRRRPRFDLVLLGLGSDGHTASLFPGSEAVEESHAWVVATAAPGGGGERALPRLTLTLPVLNAARDALFLVSGRAKATTLATILTDSGGHDGGPNVRRLPAARVVPDAG